MSKKMLFLFIIITLFFQSSMLYAEQKVLRVAIKEIPPFVMVENGKYVGYSIDLIKELGKKLNVKIKLMPCKDLSSIQNTVHDNGADLGIAALTITEKREKFLDFSHPYYISGLGILIRTEIQSPTQVIIDAFCSLVVIKAFFLFLGVLCFTGFLLWLLDLGKGSVIDDKFFPGIFEGMWCTFAIMTTIGFGDITPKKWLVRLISVPVWMCGLVVVSTINAQLISEFTVQKMEIGVHCLDDLKDKKVAVIKDSTSFFYLKQHKIGKIQQKKNLAEAYEAFKNNTVDVVVYDYPSLKYLIKKEPFKDTAVVGPFNKELYGIAFPENSNWREKINRALLSLQEEGSDTILCKKWLDA